MGACLDHYHITWPISTSSVCHLLICMYAYYVVIVGANIDLLIECK